MNKELALSSDKKFRLLEVVPIGKGKKTRIVYYDESNYEKFIKEQEEQDEWDHIIPSIEINFKKYGYETLEELAKHLETIFPGKIEAKPYGSRKNTEEYSDADFYREGQETGIIWYLGNRENKKFLEYYVDEEEKKQIFINNIEKRFTPRTRKIAEHRLDKAKEYLENFLLQGKHSKEIKKHGITVDDITINHRLKYVQLTCKEPVLKFLDKKLFRINVYDSKNYKKEEDAEKHLEEIKKIEDFKTHVDQAKIIKRRKGPFDVKYGVRITSDENESFIKKISAKGMSPAIDEFTNKRILKSREKTGDPLFLNSPTQQLRDFFPGHMRYDPNKPLKNQKNKKVPAFRHSTSNEKSDLEEAVSSAYNFYLNNSVVIDLEVTGYDKESKDRKNLTGRVFMAVFRSETEKKIYMTKEVWKNEKDKKYFKEKTKNTELVFVEDEIELIGKLTNDSSKYEFVIGHNFQEYDQRHLAKYNDENKLFKNGKISLKDKERIKSFKKKNQTKRLWNKSLKNILDTHKYVKNRVHILEDYKLATFAGFDKSISYEEMERLIKSNAKDRKKIIEYTIEDGEKSKEISDLLLRTATLESFAFNKTFSSVFSSNPVKNFYDAGARDYFMSMQTYKSRHEYSPKHNLEKLEAREIPNEIIFNLLKNEKQIEGAVEGLLIYPNAIINGCQEIIRKNPTTRLMYEEMLKEKNVLIKTIYLHNLHSALHVPVDKIKNFMESAGLEFGKRYSPTDVFTTLNNEDFETKKNELKEEDIFLGKKTLLNKIEDYLTIFFNKILGKKYSPPKEKENFHEDKSKSFEKGEEYFESQNKKFSDFELSRTNFIFCAEYKTHRVFHKKGLIPYDYTMLHINNLIADNIEAMRGSINAKTQGLYITNRNQTGFELGNAKGLNFKDKGFVGKIDNYKLFLNRKKPKDELICEMVDYYLDNNVSQKQVWRKFSKKLLEKKPEYWNKHRNYIRVITGNDLVKSGGTPSLFD